MFEARYLVVELAGKASHMRHRNDLLDGDRICFERAFGATKLA